MFKRALLALAVTFACMPAQADDLKYPVVFKCIGLTPRAYAVRRVPSMDIGLTRDINDPLIMVANNADELKELLLSYYGLHKLKQVSQEDERNSQ